MNKLGSFFSLFETTSYGAKILDCNPIYACAAAELFSIAR